MNMNGRRRRWRQRQQNNVEWKNKKSDFNAITKNAYHFTPYLKNKYHKFQRNIVRLCDYDTLKTLLHAIFHQTTYFVRWCTWIFGIHWPDKPNGKWTILPKQKQKEREKKNSEFHCKIANQVYLNEMSEHSVRWRREKNHVKSFCVYWSDG